MLPGQLGIGTLSPPLDGYGNSVRGIRACRALSGELGLHLLVIADGRASVVTTGPEGSRVRIISLAPGMFVGEVGLIDGGVRSASVVADTPVTAHRLTRTALEGLADGPSVRTRTVLLLNIAETLASHVRRATALLAAGRA